MNKVTKTNQRGFTIIEVVLVLAIAGLIFLIVFLALPQLQRSRRDTQRKNDLGRLLSALETSSSNASGAYPADAAGVDTVVAGYLTTGGGVFTDPTTGAAYDIIDITEGTATSEDDVDAAGEIGYETDAICQAAPTAADPLADGAGNRDVAVYVFQEAGGVSCSDNR